MEDTSCATIKTLSRSTEITVRSGCLVHHISIERDGGGVCLHSVTESDDGEDASGHEVIMIPAEAIEAFARAFERVRS